MANSEYNYIPTYIRRTINNRPKDVVTASYWNELFNLLITQGDHTAEELGNILNYFSTRLVGVESEIAESSEAIANIRGTTYIAVDSTDGVISTVNGETYADIQALIDAGKPVVVRYEDNLDFYYFETFGFSDSSGIHKRLNFRCDMGGIVYTLTLRDDNTWAFSETSLQPSSITDTGGYFTTDTVEGALQEIGAGLASAVKSVNGKTGAVTLNASDVGAQRPLTAGSGIMIIESEDGDIIQADTVCGNGAVSFVDVAGGAPIASFTLNQTQDCEINVNDLTASLSTKVNNLEVSISGKQDKLIAGEGITIAADGKTISSSGKVSSVNGKTGAVVLNVEDIHYANSSRTLDATIADLKAADIQTASDISELQTADASLDSRITAIETGGTPVTLYIYWESVVGIGRVSLTENGAAMSVTDFISKMQSGAKIIIGDNNDGDSESSGFSNYRYKITDSATASLAFDVANSFNGSNRTIIISGSSSTDGLMTGYQDINHDDLPDYSPLPEGSTPASKAWVENYVDTKLADGATPHIGDNGNWYIGDTDTGKPSRGEKGDTGATGETGPQGPAGADGAAGQSAYAAAQAGGYTDTQANFYTDLAAVQGLASALAAI